LKARLEAEKVSGFPLGFGYAEMIQKWLSERGTYVDALQMYARGANIEDCYRSAY